MTDLSPRPFSLCVYCGSRPGTDSRHAEAAREVGTQIGRRGWRLVYGGGRVGLMGLVADAALAAGAQVLGVIPESLVQREVGHAGLTQLEVVGTMHQRKQRMAEESDAFLALPGGIGTFEELFEVWTWRQLGYHDKPVGLLNSGGYYGRLLSFLEQGTEQGFMQPSQMALLEVSDRVETLLDALAKDASQASGPDDYSRI